jgi:hypothetical protein
MPNHNPEAQASGERRRRALFGVPCAVIFREGERRQSELRTLSESGAVIWYRY